MDKKSLQILAFAVLNTIFMEGAVVAKCPNPDNPVCCDSCVAVRNSCIRNCGPGVYGREVQGSPEQICEANCYTAYHECANTCN